MTPAVNITNKPMTLVSSEWETENKRTGVINTGTTTKVVASDWYCRERPQAVTSPWTEVKGVRWRHPLAWFHNSVHLHCSVGGVQSLSENSSVFCKQKWPADVAGYPAMQACLPGGINTFTLIEPESLNLISRAEVDALNNLKLGDVQWGETIAQWRQTAALFTNNITTIARQIIAFRRRYRIKKLERVTGRKARKRVKRAKSCRGCSISDKYLEMVYGWIPLLQDIQGSLELLDDKASKNGIVVRARGSARDTGTKTVGVGNQTAGYSPGFTMTTSPLSATTEHRVGVILWYLLEDINVARLSALGLANPVELAWNLIPFSFVLDWAIPIGPWLGSFTADSGFGFISGTKSYKRKVTEAIPVSCTPVQNPSGILHSCTAPSGKIHCKAEFFRRTVYLSRPVPGLYYKNPLSVRHVMNAIALLRSAIR